MEALDALTLRKRRDRLFNPITAPHAVLEAALFMFVPASPIAPNNIFLRLQGMQNPTDAQFQGMNDTFRVLASERDRTRAEQQQAGGPAFNTRSRDEEQEETRGVRQSLDRPYDAGPPLAVNVGENRSVGLGGQPSFPRGAIHAGAISRAGAAAA